MSTEQLATTKRLSGQGTLREKLPFPHKKKWRSLTEKRKRLAWLFMLPLIIFNVVVILGPSLSTAYYAFTDWTGLGDTTFIGLANFQRLLTDKEFFQAIRHNLVWMALFLTIPIALALLASFLLSQVKHFLTFFRTVFFIPVVIATIVNAAIWQNLLNPSVGLAVGLSQLGIHWLDNMYFLGDKNLALPTVAMIAIWGSWGFNTVLLLSAMQGINTDLYGAARVDGANRWRQFYHVTLPGIRPTLMFIILTTIIGSLLVFDYVFILTAGGPGGSTEVIGTLLYRRALTENDAGYAAAQALCTAFICAFFAAGIVYLRRKGWDI